jgi:hypothetical protein
MSVARMDKPKPKKSPPKTWSKKSVKDIPAKDGKDVKGGILKGAGGYGNHNETFLV